jgi:hypothetical protein
MVKRFLLSLFSLALALQLSSALACTLSSDLELALQEAAQAYGLEPLLFQALIYQESRYCTDALSPKGAIGLGQLMPGTAQGLGVDPYDPVQNLLGAAAYLRNQWDSFEDWNLALAAYNAGPGAVIKYQGVPPYEETQNYVVSILSRYTALLEELPQETVLVEVEAPVTPQAGDEATLVSVLPALASPEAAPDVTLAPGYEIEQPKPALLIASNERPDLSKIPIMMPTDDDAGLTIFNRE